MQSEIYDRICGLILRIYEARFASFILSSNFASETRNFAARAQDDFKSFKNLTLNFTTEILCPSSERKNAVLCFKIPLLGSYKNPAPCFSLKFRAEILFYNPAPRFYTRGVSALMCRKKALNFRFIARFAKG